MPFCFVYVCDLLEQLSNIAEHDPPYLIKDVERRTADAIINWFKNHRLRIEAHDTDGVALLSALLPEKRTDKVYCMQADTLEKCLGRALSIGTSRLPDLARWREPGKGDLADCLERVLRQAENPVPARGNKVTTEEIEDVLIDVAAKKNFSSSAVRQRGQKFSVDDTTLLKSLYNRLQSREAKWLTRLILKNYSPVIIPETLIYRYYHYLLPDLLKVQSEFTAALEVLRSGRLRGIPSMPCDHGQGLGKKDFMKDLLPKISVKVGRPNFFKARSIKHCSDMAQNRKMSVEKKYDGEYCQVHIDMTKDRWNWIKMFSKSGKDSTKDRVNLHSTIMNCLRLGQADCKITTKCILEGELLVYSDKERKILDFHNIRRHVMRSGRLLGCENDSLPGPWEHLMIVFFDLMLLDDTPILHLKNNERRQHLEEIVNVAPGYAELAERKTISFSEPSAAQELRNMFASCITAGGEGLIVKPTDDPYFNFTGSYTSYVSCCIKLKKEYIGKFGDVGDLAVVGARYDALRAKELRIPNAQWTELWLGCLMNKAELHRWEGTKPCFKVVKTISPRREIIEELMRYADCGSVKFEDNHAIQLDVAKGIANGKNPTTVFTQPPVFDMRCFGFDKEGNTGFWTLRFADVSKIHFDRTYKDTLSFEELQAMAVDARACPENEIDAQEDLEWIAKLKKADPGGIAVDAITPSTTRGTQSTTMTPSPLRQCESQPSPLATRPESILANRRELRRSATMESAINSKTENDHDDHRTSLAKDRDFSMQHSNSEACRPAPGALETFPTPELESQETAFLSPTAVNVITSPMTSMKRTLIDRDGMHLIKKQRTDDTPEIKKAILDSEEQSTTTSHRQSGPLVELTNDNHTFVNQDNLVRNHDSELPKASRSHPSTKGKVHFDILCDDENEPSPARGSLNLATMEESPLSSSTQSENPYITPTSSAVQIENPPSLELTEAEFSPMPCDLSKCQIYLSPCVSGIPFLTENLMDFHGATFTTNLSDLRESFASDLESGRSTRKIALVEIRREKATVKTLERIKGLKLQEDGRKVRVEVYDHRLLECMWNRARGKIAKDISSLWNNSFIAAI